MGNRGACARAARIALLAVVLAGALALTVSIAAAASGTAVEAPRQDEDILAPFIAFGLLITLIAGFLISRRRR